VVKRRRLIRRIASIAALTVAVTGMAAIGLNADVFAGCFQRRATDALFPAAPDDGDIAVVGFDTKTIDPDSGLGYPLPREKVAVLVDNLEAAGARVIAFDVIYRSASPSHRRSRRRPERPSARYTSTRTRATASAGVCPSSCRRRTTRRSSRRCRLRP
jgi:CHASE2 domain-containing sensor protein